MKIKALLAACLTIGILSCDKKSSQVDKLTDGIWTLESTSVSYENLKFEKDMTYKITSLVKIPVNVSQLPVETGYVTGEWSLENNRITYLTAHVELNSYIRGNADELPLIEGQPVEGFYGYVVNGILQDSSSVDNVIRGVRDSIFFDYEYSPAVWIIEELSDNALVVKNGTTTIKYRKQ